MTKYRYRYVGLFIFLAGCAKPENDVLMNSPNIYSIIDVIDIGIRKETQDIVLPEEAVIPLIVNECQKDSECPDDLICDLAGNIQIPVIQSLCTNSCLVIDRDFQPYLDNTICQNAPSAICCTARAQEDSYFIQNAFCVPEEFCCNAGEKLCKANCCPREWYCSLSGQCLPQCANNGDCEDEYICTNDECVEGVCKYSNKYGCCLNDEQCQDSDFCTIDICLNNWCEHLDNPECECQPPDDLLGNCNDNNIQTKDVCNSGICVNINIPGVCESDQECDDGLKETTITCIDNHCHFDCVYNCAEKECGHDGCGGKCGTCEPGTFCNSWQQCECDPEYWCQGKECGPDQCAGVCGVCPLGYKCNEEGKCEYTFS